MMRIYIRAYHSDEQGKPVAELCLGYYRPEIDEYEIIDPMGSHHQVKADHFDYYYRPLTRLEAQLVNRTVAELEVMAISDNQGEP